MIPPFTGNVKMFLERWYYFMKKMIVKSVDIMGDTVMAAKDKDGNILVGVSYICNALGMSKGQKDKQVQNVQKDVILKRGCFKLEAGVIDPNNEVVALKIEFIPIWLAKISIVDKTKQENPDLADKLLNYQLKAKDILAAAFLPTQVTLPKTTDDKIALLAQGHTELRADIEEIKAEVNAIKLDLPILPIEAERITEAVRKKGVSVLGGKHSNAYADRGLRQKLYNSLYSNLKYNFGVKSYKSIKRSQTDKAIEIINEYKTPLFLAEQISDVNAQKSFDLEGGIVR